MILRTEYLEQVWTGLGRGPVVALIGPRQCGKTTLAWQLMGAGEAGYFDLEDPATARVLESPMSLKLKELLVVYPGTREYPLAENIRAMPLAKACGMRGGE